MRTEVKTKVKQTNIWSQDRGHIHISNTRYVPYTPILMPIYVDGFIVEDRLC